ncbi:hypothetical protein cyc_06846 [Cyclospora cayetanensis]|uniref:Uncharacterized protein n=1 Tax=Cyclospora cayetanensis TaxID=88456 RepID=A0A1D3CUC7_9EIME|nr:hypothetical protein cyc_06846 [Cyclospora cayetanensis]
MALKCYFQADFGTLSMVVDFNACFVHHHATLGITIGEPGDGVQSATAMRCGGWWAAKRWERTTGLFTAASCDLQCIPLRVNTELLDGPATPMYPSSGVLNPLTPERLAMIRDAIGKSSCAGAFSSLLLCFLLDAFGWQFQVLLWELRDLHNTFSDFAIHILRRISNTLTLAWKEAVGTHSFTCRKRSRGDQGTLPANTQWQRSRHGKQSARLSSRHLQGLVCLPLGHTGVSDTGVVTASNERQSTSKEAPAFFFDGSEAQRSQEGTAEAVDASPMKHQQLQEQAATRETTPDEKDEQQQRELQGQQPHEQRQRASEKSPVHWKQDVVDKLRLPASAHLWDLHKKVHAHLGPVLTRDQFLRAFVDGCSGSTVQLCNDVFEQLKSRGLGGQPDTIAMPTLLQLLQQFHEPDIRILRETTQRLSMNFKTLDETLQRLQGRSSAHEFAGKWLLRYLQRLMEGCTSEAELLLNRRSPQYAVQTFNHQLKEAQPYWERAVAVEHKLALEQARVLVSKCLQNMQLELESDIEELRRLQLAAEKAAADRKASAAAAERLQNITQDEADRLGLNAASNGVVNVRYVYEDVPFGSMPPHIGGDVDMTRDMSLQMEQQVQQMQQQIQQQLHQQFLHQRIPVRSLAEVPNVQLGASHVVGGLQQIEALTPGQIEKYAEHYGIYPTPEAAAAALGGVPLQGVGAMKTHDNGGAHLIQVQQQQQQAHGHQFSGTIEQVNSMKQRQLMRMQTQRQNA